MSITVYEKETGKIKYFVESDPVNLKVTKENLDEPWIEGTWDWDTHYVKHGKAVKRPKNPCYADGQTLLNVSVPSVVWVNDTKYECNESTVELEFDQPGTYTIRVQSWPYLDAEFEIEN